jgi:hypothetical protein
MSTSTSTPNSVPASSRLQTRRRSSIISQTNKLPTRRPSLLANNKAKAVEEDQLQSKISSISPRQQRRRSSVLLPKRRPSLAPSAGSEANTTQQERRNSLPLALALDISAAQEHEHEHGSSSSLLQHSWKEEEEEQQQNVLGEVLYWC